MSSNRFLIALSFLFTVSLSFGQKDAEVKQWKQLESTDGVVISFRKGNCDEPKLASYTENVYLKFTNTTDETIYVTWTFDATYGDRCFNCDGSNEEMTQTFKIAPNSSVEGECGDKNDRHLTIFSKFTNMENPEPLNAFNVKLLSVDILSTEEPAPIRE